MSRLQDLADRVERLIVRYEELQRVNGLLEQKIEHLEQEKELLQSRLFIARSRIDTLLQQIPEEKL